jgi:hypothetical protein
MGLGAVFELMEDGARVELASEGAESGLRFGQLDVAGPPVVADGRPAGWCAADRRLRAPAARCGAGGGLATAVAVFRSARSRAVQTDRRPGDGAPGWLPAALNLAAVAQPARGHTLLERRERLLHAH